MNQPTPKIIDNITQYPTPEGLMLELVPAGLMARASAWVLDLAVRGLILVVCFIPLILFKLAGVGLFLIIMFLVNWLYPVFFEVWREGMTVGKKYSGIYVCHDDGTPISLQSSLVRNLLRVVDFLPFFYSTGVLSILFNRKSQRLGDMVAGTIVVYQEKDDMSQIYRSVYKLMENQPQAKISLNPQTHYEPTSPLFYFPLTLQEQQALLSLSDRLPFLPIARQKEITQQISPLVQTSNKLAVRVNNIDVVHDAVLARAKQLKGGES
ncbi:MAG: RDD family protein [Moraxellaceae bacterium]|nr:RDD family protein [Moraxellaceae bacterium]